MALCGKDCFAAKCRSMLESVFIRFDEDAGYLGVDAVGDLASEGQNVETTVSACSTSGGAA